MYRITGELQGFATVAQSGLELLVGQQVAVNLQMVPSAVQESVTVTGEVPLVDTTTSTRIGNVDPRQMQELPINGRNWMDLALLAPGSRRNEGGIPDNRQGYSQLNVDGQPIGLQVNAITKSGTNTPSGLFSGYFRDARFNAPDFIQQRVLPYSNQQLSGTFWRSRAEGPDPFLRELRVRARAEDGDLLEPISDVQHRLVQHPREDKAGARLDVQFTSQSRAAVRGQYYNLRWQLGFRFAF